MTDDIKTSFDANMFDALACGLPTMVEKVIGKDDMPTDVDDALRVGFLFGVAVLSQICDVRELMLKMPPHVAAKTVHDVMAAAVEFTNKAGAGGLIKISAFDLSTIAKH